MQDNAPTLAAAYLAARCESFMQGGRVIRPAPASRALALARERLADLATARAAWESARADLAAANAHAEPFKAQGFGPHTVTPPEAAPALRAASEAQAKEAAALRRVSALRSLCGAYGGRPFTRRKPGAWGEGERGRLFHFDDAGRGPSVLRDVRDAETVRGCRRVASFYDNPHGESFKDGSGLVIPVVAQLRGRDGRARFVPGYRFGGASDAGAFMLSDIYTASGNGTEEAEEAQADAARAAESLAEKAAEREREYQGAWGAGRAWAEEGERVAALREEARELLRERRAARSVAPAAFPRLCETVRRRVSAILSEIADARETRARLADGEESPYWHDGGATARAAFCDAAGINMESFPA